MSMDLQDGHQFDNFTGFCPRSRWQSNVDDVQVARIRASTFPELSALVRELSQVQAQRPFIGFLGLVNLHVS